MAKASSGTVVILSYREKKLLWGEDDKYNLLFSTGRPIILYKSDNKP